jgi:hypothetical protein
MLLRVETIVDFVMLEVKKCREVLMSLTVTVDEMHATCRIEILFEILSFV